MERDKLICMLIGYYVAKMQNINEYDMQILIDQNLVRANYLPLNDQDKELIQELIDESSWFVISKGVNRETRRTN